MKRKLYIYLLYFVVLGACTKKMDVISPDFNVTTSSLTYSTGEKVEFTFQGDADVITFYSGEEGNNYDYKERTLVSGGGIDLSFSTSVQGGSQQNNLSMWVSLDFDGNYTKESVQKATWVEVTNRFDYATNSTYKPSGIQDISDIVPPNQSFYIAYKYVGQASSPASQRGWNISDLLVSERRSSGNVLLSAQNTVGWSFIDIGGNPLSEWRLLSSFTLIFVTGNTLDYSEEWAISKPIISGLTEPDRGIPIKSFRDSRLSQFTHTYSRPGTYKVVFVASNANVDGAKTIKKELTITVKEKEIQDPDFTVSTSSLTYKVGERVDFMFDGNADEVLFWSGQEGNNYDYRNRTAIESEAIEFSFLSNVNGGTQENNLSVWISLDFDGKYTKESAQNANWTEVTDRFVYGTNVTFVPSGVQDISDIVVPGQPFYIGYKFVGQPDAPPYQKGWKISGLKLEELRTDSKILLSTQQTIGWSFIDIGGNPISKWRLVGYDLLFQTGNTKEYSEAWAVSKPIMSGVIEPDKGVYLKRLTDAPLSLYTYSFNTPGVYKVVFEAVNSNSQEDKKILRELVFTIIP